jgi:hypothetical protein
MMLCWWQRPQQVGPQIFPWRLSIVLRSVMTLRNGSLPAAVAAAALVQYLPILNAAKTDIILIERKKEKQQNVENIKNYLTIKYIFKYN